MEKAGDYYEALGLSRTATAEEIRKAYRRLARKYHPDVSQSADAASRFSEISEAYEVLGDPEKRKTYDRFGRAGVGAGPDGFSHAGWTGAPDVEVGDLGSIFEEILGGGRASPFGTRRAAPSQPRRGRDVEQAVDISFMTAVTGGTEQVRLSSAAGGEQTVSVKIPAGLESGSRLRVKGHGQPGPAGGQPGDLILRVNVGAHPRLRREGLDLLADVPIDITEAALGATVDVPLVKGTATIKVPPGASSGQKLRIRGQGIQGEKGQKGDFLAVLRISAPSTLSPRARQLLEELRGELQNQRQTGP